MPRRANREGSLYRRKDGRWVGSVSLPNGRRKSYYGKTRAEVAHKLFLEGVYVDRTEQGLKPRLVKVAPPTDTDIAEVVQKISRRVIRKLR